MSLLEKLRIAPDSEEEYPEEEDGEIGGGNRDEYQKEFNPNHDPVPGEPGYQAKDQEPAKGRSRRSSVASAAPRVTKKMREDAAEEVETFLHGIALVWGLQAPPCGDALDDAAPDVADKVVKLLARNPKWLMRVREGGFLGDVVKLAMALKPVARVTWDFYRQPSGGANDVEFDPSKFPAFSAGA